MADIDTPKPDTRNKRPKPARKAASHGRTSSITGGLALIVALIALVATTYLWYALLLQQADLLSTDVVGDLDKLEQQTQELGAGLGVTSSSLDDVRANQDSMRAALDKIQNDLSRHRVEWVLAESEQLLVIANNRLQLARDVRSALAALRAADMQLNQIPNPSLLPVRREIAREISLLEAIDKADVSGISLALGSLADSVDNLPLAPNIAQRAQPAAATAPAATDEARNWRTQARSLWQDLRSLVRFRTDIGVPRTLLPPEQAYFARENLKLKLHGAQFALLQGNVGVFQQNLAVARQLLEEYYDGNTQVVAATHAELDKLAASRLVAELPDITRSLNALRAITATRSAP